MDPFTIAVILIIIGAVLLIIEAFSPGAFLVIPGTVLVVIGVIGALFPKMVISWELPVIALIVAIPTTLITIKMYQRLGTTEKPTTMVADSLIGKTGIVTKATQSGNMKGKVRIGSDTWSATSDTPIDEGTEVIVDSSEGVHVHVKPIE